ncbi:putative inositol monophosphatase 3 [Aricia agestis]|uniref:putative inositol monophosphatase 3 n=1 Tax=Aricia agestis TaxID=91739 RepID=UPI001C204D06|nr:putative inositol monophosphatase 3 [Aricia agestis]XP_041986694.1 putative inositol monophosphatase 3 [Aricia agestis]XP_041986695.1 putative inositol monophosphatase 3 [Aricia agestis]XP_041986696.1 putative inositol monophosphatase 3 [Aricia agestis]
MNFGGTLRINKFACFTLGFIMFLIIYWRSGGSSFPSDKSDLVNIKSLLKAAIYVAEQGGHKVVGNTENLNVQSKGKTEEGANNPVTDADYASHCVMYYSLKNTFPKINIISEEHTTDSTCTQQKPIDVDALQTDDGTIDYLNDEHVYAKDVTIWIDPLDATQEYTEKLYKYVTTMVCVAINSVPIVGVIHYPFTPRTYWGWATKATSNNIPKAVQHRVDNKDHPRVVISRSHAGKVSDIAKEAFGPKTNVSQAAGAGYKVMSVINGEFDVYFHSTAIKKWDLCAGNAIINAVDGKMTTAKGESINYSPGTNVKVSDGLLVARYDHDYYLSKMPKMLSSVPK